MSEKIVQLNEEVIKGQLKELVRGSVEETLNELLEADVYKRQQKWWATDLLAYTNTLPVSILGGI